MKNDKQRCGTRRYHQSEMKNPTTLISGTVTPKWTVPGERNLQVGLIADEDPVYSLENCGAPFSKGDYKEFVNSKK